MCSSKQPTSTQQDVRTTNINVPDYLQYPVQQNAARAQVVGQRPYEAYGGQRVAGYDSGFGQAQGIAQALQTGGPQSYSQTSFNQAPDYQQTGFTPTSFQRTQGFTPTQYNQSAYNPAAIQEGSDYSYGGYQAGTYGAGNQYSGQGSYMSQPGAAGYDPREATLREYSQQDVDKYMSPYLNNVVDSQVDRANLQFDRDMAVTRLQSARGGGYGDYGSRVTEAILRSDHNRNVNDMVADSLQTGFRDATGMMQSWRDADLSAQGLSQADRQFGGQLNQSDRQFGRTSDLNDAQYASDYSLRQAQELNSRNMSERQFGAGMDTENAQFGAGFNQDRINQLNSLREQQAQFGFDAASSENRFGADMLSRERQFGSSQTADDIARYNELTSRQNEFGAQFAADQNQFGTNYTADQIMRLNEMRMQDSQFGANYGLNARDQYYDQQMGVADTMREEADRRMRYEQAGLDTQYQDFLESRDWDQNQISWLTSVLYGTPGSVQQNYQNVYSNPLAQGLGAAAAVSGLMNNGAS
jgi:bisphosphoglycerate-dependent phosphoglycerate mutase